MPITEPATPDNSQLGLRLLMALCVAVATYFAWAVLWVIGGVASGLASILAPQHSLGLAERFGNLWQWVVASLAIGLVCSLLAIPRYSRRVAIGWFLAIAALAINATLLPGQFEPALGPLIPVILAAGILVWIHRAAMRAA